jgi:hypothetical protein
MNKFCSILQKKSRGEQGNNKAIYNRGSQESTNPVIDKKRGIMDHIREVPIVGATEMIRTVCKETLQSLVTTFTNMELNIRVKRFTRMTDAIADYVGREYSK